MNNTIKSFKIRLYPTKEQEALMRKHIGACRYVWNFMLEKQKKLYQIGEKHLSAFDMINLLKPLKQDDAHFWLYEISNASMQVECRDLDKAYQSFFKKQSRYPKFKSKKKSKPNYPVRSDALYFTKDNKANIEKIGKVKFKTDFNLPTGKGFKFTNARVSNINGKWMLSFGMEHEGKVQQLNDFSVGIDLGIKESATVAYSGKELVFHNINKSRKIRMLKKQIEHLQRQISRKYEANKLGTKYIKTRNIERKEIKLRKLYARLSNLRTNYIHQSTHSIISLLPKRVVMEDLNIAGMMKNRHLSKAIQEQCLYEWIRQMKYKCEWNGIEFVQVDRFYPSSKTCHQCGCVKHNLKLNDRTYICEECGYTADRDLNAALNLMDYGNQ